MVNFNGRMGSPRVIIPSSLSLSVPSRCNFRICALNNKNIYILFVGTHFVSDAPTFFWGGFQTDGFVCVLHREVVFFVGQDRAMCCVLAYPKFKTCVSFERGFILLQKELNQQQYSCWGKV